MNKKINEYCTSHSLKVSGNKAYGKIRGYEVNLSYSAFDNVAPVRLHFSCCATDQQKKLVLNGIKDAKIRFLNAEFSYYGLLIGLNDLTVNKLVARMDQIIDTVLTVLITNNVLNSSYCPVCGEELHIENSKQYNIEGSKITLDNNCATNINEVISQENKDYDSAPNNYLKGFLGALIGAVAGAVISYILFLIGFVSAISALVAVVLGSFLYRKLGGKPNIGMIIIVTVTTILVLLLTVFIIYLGAAALLAPEYGITATGMDAFNAMMELDEFAAEFTSNMIMTLLFSLIGCGYEVYVLAKSIKRKNTI